MQKCNHFALGKVIDGTAQLEYNFLKKFFKRHYSLQKGEYYGIHKS